MAAKSVVEGSPLGRILGFKQPVVNAAPAASVLLQVVCDHVVLMVGKCRWLHKEEEEFQREEKLCTFLSKWDKK